MRLIDGDDFQKRIEQLCDALCEYSKKQRQYMCSACKLGNVLDVIDDAPTVDAVQVQHGRWIDKSGGIEGAWNYCYVCGEQAIDLYDYCPNCGARMDGDDNG